MRLPSDSKSCLFSVLGRKHRVLSDIRKSLAFLTEVPRFCQDPSFQGSYEGAKQGDEGDMAGDTKRLGQEHRAQWQFSSLQGSTLEAPGRDVILNVRLAAAFGL